MLAATFSESSKCWGSRSEIVLVVGFKFGSLTFWALDQSRCALESWDSQYARSWASLANFGIALVCLFINGSLLSMHVPG